MRSFFVSSGSLYGLLQVSLGSTTDVWFEKLKRWKKTLGARKQSLKHCESCKERPPKTKCSTSLTTSRSKTIIRGEGRLGCNMEKGGNGGLVLSPALFGLARDFNCAGDNCKYTNWLDTTASRQLEPTNKTFDLFTTYSDIWTQSNQGHRLLTFWVIYFFFPVTRATQKCRTRATGRLQM